MGGSRAHGGVLLKGILESQTLPLLCFWPLRGEKHPLPSALCIILHVSRDKSGTTKIPGLNFLKLEVK